MKEIKNRFPQAVLDYMAHDARCKEREAKGKEFIQYSTKYALRDVRPPGPIEELINSIFYVIGSVAMVLWFLAIIISVGGTIVLAILE